MNSRRPALALALLFSLLLHLLVVGSGEIPFPSFPDASAEVLASRQPPHVQRVRLASRPPAAAKPRAGAAPVARGSLGPRHAPAESSPRDLAADAPQQPDAAADAPAPTLPPEAEPAAMPTAPPLEPAPAFPVQLAAGLEARVNGLSATLTQTWVMEGFRYAIEVKGSKFGYHALIASEGRLNPEGGLSPERSSLTLGGKVRSLTEYREGSMRMGKPEALQDYPLPVVPQDFASLPFHLAVTFNGTPQSLFVSTGRRLYQARFSLVAEETLRLPVGTLRTLHLEGERFDYGLREMVPAFDIWLAPDYLNFPVKVSGHLSGGEPIEYRVKWLDIEGKRVLGDTAEASPPGSDETIPAWLREQGLKNP